MNRERCTDEKMKGRIYLFAILFVVCPHADDFDCFDGVEYLVDKSMLDIDSS